MSVSTLFLASLAFVGIGLLLALLGLILGLLFHISKKGGVNLRSGTPALRAAFFLIVGGGLAFGVSVVMCFAAVLWWGFAWLLADTSPGHLALVSIVVGVTPLLITAIGAGLAAVSGGKVDASGAHDCSLFGLNLNPLVYTLFMSYWLMFFTLGFAMFGLFGSGIWALVRLF